MSSDKQRADKAEVGHTPSRCVHVTSMIPLSACNGEPVPAHAVVHQGSPNVVTCRLACSCRLCGANWRTTANPRNVLNILNVIPDKLDVGVRNREGKGACNRFPETRHSSAPIRAF